MNKKKKDNDILKPQQEIVPEYFTNGTSSSWYIGEDLSDAERDVFRHRSKMSAEAKRKALIGDGEKSVHSINYPTLCIDKLIPNCSDNGLQALSLFSGGGGLDLGFDLAGFSHVASYEILDHACETLAINRPDWTIFSGKEGDVTSVDWGQFRKKIDIIHGGPPCQPFSMAGRQRGATDARDMFPEFVRAVKEIKPQAFLAENVPALKQAKFTNYLDEIILNPLKSEYTIFIDIINADSFGVPQTRRRVFFVGFRNKKLADRFSFPTSTHDSSHLQAHEKSGHIQKELFYRDIDPHTKQECMGVRKALGLPDIGFDALAPTLRSTLTGPRHTTSILSSTAASRLWGKLQIWPNGVQLTREKANAFLAKNDHFRLSLEDCKVIQGFPEKWEFYGPAYKALGQLGNSVAPPVAYHVAKSIAHALL